VKKTKKQIKKLQKKRLAETGKILLDIAKRKPKLMKQAAAALEEQTAQLVNYPSVRTSSGGVRIVLDLDDLALALHGPWTAADVVEQVMTMLKPWGLSDEALRRFDKIVETGQP
jgi:hypothetical protein